MLTQNESIEQVYCLVRKSGSSNLNGLARLKAMAEKYHLVNLNWTKVTSIEGTVTEDKLGMGSKIYEYLLNTVDGVIHNAAKVNHTETYRNTTPAYPDDDLRAVNVDGLKTVLEFTCVGRPKKFCYTSTFVTAREPDSISKKMNEDWCKDDEYDKCGDLGYATSKFIGEKLVQAAVERGLTRFVLRLPLIGGDSVNGMIYNSDKNHILLRFLSYLQTWLIPKEPSPINLMPVVTGD